MHALRFFMNDQLVEEAAVSPTMTLLNYLRQRLDLTGTKEGCAEGDCGACSVIILDPDAPDGPRFRAINSCLVMLPMVQGKRVYSVEALKGADGALHPTQAALVQKLGSQCGYCTPGIVMSMFEGCYRADMDEDWKLDDQMCGNLCRCTGYRPIRDAARQVAGARPDDRFLALLAAAQPAPMTLDYAHGDQRFWTPDSLASLWDVLEANPDAHLISGGTDLSLEVTKRFKHLQKVISLDGIPSLARVEDLPDGGWRVGATARLTDIEAAARDRLPTLERMLRFFASRQIKHRATLGGNISTASPIGDTPPVMLALGAVFVLASRAGERRVPADQFFVSYRKTARRPDEILAAVEIPPVPADAKTASYKVSKRRELDISAVSASFFVRVDPATHLITTARLAFGGVAATPARASRAEAALTGQPWSEDTFEAAAVAIADDFTPLSDHRGSAWYRHTVAANLLRGFWLEAQSASTSSPRLPDRPTSTLLLPTP
jgi:xanthine dehydrogenase small subunit